MLADRMDQAFEAECVFCGRAFLGNRSDVLEHMHHEHQFNLGHPDNLVLVRELLRVLQGLVLNNQCLFCEALQPSRAELLEHMKRRQHRKLNAKNTSYDKYYIINYLELGRGWEDVMADEDTDIWRELKREEYNWFDWREEPGQGTALPFYVCLFCDLQSEMAESFQAHLMQRHGFSFNHLVQSFEYTFYDQVEFYTPPHHGEERQVCVE